MRLDDEAWARTQASGTAWGGSGTNVAQAVH